MSDKALESKFVCGLKEDIKSEMRKLNPVALTTKMEIAQIIEDDLAMEMKRVKGLTGHSSPNPSTKVGSVGSTSSSSKGSNSTTYISSNSATQTIAISTHRSTSASSMTITPTRSMVGTFTPTTAPYHRLMDTKMQIKKEKGICFKCDGKFNADHRGPKRELNVFVAQEGEDLSDLPDKVEGTEEKEETIDAEVATLSLNSLVEFDSPKTLKVKGEIQGKVVAVLIDGGATHNFVSEEIVQELKLPVSPSEDYGIVLGTRGTIRAARVCQSVLLRIVELAIQGFLPLPLGRANVILGVAWLETLGKIQFDYRLSEMEFWIGDWLVHLCGDRSLVKSQISLKSMMKSLPKEDQGMLIELSALDLTGEVTEGEDDEERQRDIHKLLQKFSTCLNR